MSIPVSVPSLSLEGKTAIVTGGGTGIGRAIALEFARAGANVVVGGRTLATLEEVAGVIKAMGGRCLAVQTDIAKKADVENLVKKTVDEFGIIDISANNAGIGSAINGKIPPWLIDFPEDHWKKVVDIDLDGCFRCCQAVGKVMVNQKKGNIINTASVSAYDGWANPYGVSKAGVVRLTRGLAKDLGSYNIRVNAIAPAYVRVPAGVVNRDDEVALYDDPEALKRVPLGRVAEPVDIATIALFLASDASNYITGQTIIADGGRL